MPRVSTVYPEFLKFINWIHWVQHRSRVPLCSRSHAGIQALGPCVNTCRLFAKRNARSTAFADRPACRFSAAWSTIELLERQVELQNVIIKGKDSIIESQRGTIVALQKQIPAQPDPFVEWSKGQTIH